MQHRHSAAAREGLVGLGLVSMVSIHHFNGSAECVVTA